jgi:hypothetical protein
LYSSLNCYREAVWVVGRNPLNCYRSFDACRAFRIEAHLDQLRGAVEPDDAAVHAHYPTDQGFSKKLENHAATVALYFIYYNFARVHQTRKVTAAMESGTSDHVWSIDEIVGRLDRTSAEGA